MIRLLARAALLAAVALFVGLGIWQVERRAWKLALIEQVQRGMTAAPSVASPADRPIDADAAYRRVQVDGHYVRGHDVLVQAVTELGGGFWVMTPLDAPQGRILINRGFVPGHDRGRAAPPPRGAVTVTGLLRLTEPGGGFLRSNDPVGGRWFSRDVAAIASAQGLGHVAPWFVDAGWTGPGWPRGGMTMVRFPNNHLVYALTWFALAALFAFLAWRARRGRRIA